MPFPWRKKNKPTLPSGKPVAVTNLPAVQYTFYCQLAHGSPTGVVSGFANMKQLYEKIAECFDIDSSNIMFCTLNSHKINMENLLNGQLGLDDFIFAHVKGQRKEVEITKEENTLGLTLTDNGVGIPFVKRIRAGSVIDKLGRELVDVGDHIERVNDKVFAGKRHYDVAKALNEIALGEKFLLRLVSPEVVPFSNVAPRSAMGIKGGITGASGKKTLRLKAGAPFQEEEVTEKQTSAIDAINQVLETVLGLEDSELAQTIWDLGSNKINSHDFSNALEVELGEFGFCEETVFDLWGAISDAKAGRVKRRID